MNNDIGVPLTLLRLGAEHRRLVVELGANHPGEIAMLSAMALPRVGVITLIAPAHLQGFGDIDAVARAKGELISALPRDGVAVVNADDDYMSLWRKLAQQRTVMSFGFAAAAQVQVAYDADRRHRDCRGNGDRERGTGVTLTIGADEFHVRLQLCGRHNAVNAGAAAAAALAMGIDPGCIQRGLEATAPAAGSQPRLPTVRTVRDRLTSNRW